MMAEEAMSIQIPLQENVDSQPTTEESTVRKKAKTSPTPSPPPTTSKTKFKFKLPKKIPTKSMQFFKSFFVGILIVELVYINLMIASMTGDEINFLPNSSLEIHAFDEHINGHSSYPLDFIMDGCTFNELGPIKEIKSAVQTSLLYSFSPMFEKDAAKKFLDPPKELVNHAISPAVKWFHGELVVVARVSLNHERFTHGHKRTLNIPMDNWLYYQKFDRNLEPLTYGRLIAIPMTKTFEVGDGPIEPRLLIVQDRLMVTFNGMGHSKDLRFVDYTYMFDLEKQEMLIPEIEESPIFGENSGKPPIDKHWLPLIRNDDLYFVHNLEPLWVMKCTIEFKCSWVYREVRPASFMYDSTPFVGAFRGGTPFEHYEGKYYISVAHNTLVKGTNAMRYYTAHLVVLHVNPYRIVYVGNKIQLRDEIYHPAPMQRYWDIEDDFMFPVGLIVEDPDSLVISTHINDANSIMIRMTGIRKIMTRVMKLDEKAQPEKGPPIGAINKQVKSMLEGLTGMFYV